MMGILTTFEYFATSLSIYKWMKGFNIYTNKIREGGNVIKVRINYLFKSL